MKILNVKVANKIATYRKLDGAIVCGNSDYQVKFAFDEEWAEHNEKTARFIWNGRFEEKEFTGDTCEVPIIRNAAIVEVGVYAGNLKTTTSAVIPAMRSVLCSRAIPTPENEQHYASEAKEAAARAETAMTEAKEAASVAADRAAVAATKAATEEVTRLVGELGVVQNTGDSPTAVMSQKASTAEFEKTNQKILRNAKRITNLEQGLTPEPFETDDSVAYQKDVPENALPYAEITKVGGMTYKDVGYTNLMPKSYDDGSGDYAGVFITVNDDGTITANGTAETSVEFYLFTALDYEGSVDCILSGCPKIGGCSIELSANRDVLDTGEGVRFVLDHEAVRYCRINIGGGTTLNNVVFNPSLAKVSEELLSAPVTEVKSVGVNLFDISKLSGMDRLVVSGDKINVTTAPDNSGVTSASRIKDVAPQLKVGDIVTLTAITTGSDKYIYLEEALMPWYYGISKTITEVMLNSRITFYASGVSTSATISDIMLNKGSTALPYTPYVEHTLPIPTAVQALDGYGEGVNESVYNYIDWEKKQFVKRVEKIVFRGTESWVALPSNPNIFYIKISNAASRADGGSLLANGYEYSNSALTVDKSCTVSDSLYFLDNGCGSLNEWKAYLAELYATDTPLTVVYVIATPVITDISDLITSDNLIGVEGNGTITFENEYGYAVPSEVTYQLKGATA